MAVTSERSIGFRRLARYIFGANHRHETMSMTAPVGQQQNREGDEIAMTAPVAQSRNTGGHWTIKTIPKQPVSF